MKMEVFQPIPVLPSNAPPWTGVEDDESRQFQVLQEQCGNRQLGYLPSQRSASAYTGEDGSSPDEDFAHGGILDSQQPGRGAMSYAPSHMSGYGYPSLANENIYASVPSVKHGYLSHRPQGQRHRRPEETTHARDERKRDAQSRRLAALFSQCEGYLKYRNRQPKEGKGASKDQKWPDHMEDAFLRALVHYPPVGRRKQPPRPGMKQMGRNELIADYILMATNEERTRKQVSSHIQVLKPFVLDEPDIMFYLAAAEKDAPNRQAATSARRQASMYPIKSQFHLDLHRKAKQPVSLQSVFDLELEEFKMYMRTPETAQPPLKTLHEYTRYAPLQDTHKPICIRDPDQMDNLYPELSYMPPGRLHHSARFISVHSNISLHDPRAIAAQAPNNKIELAISLVFSGPALHPSYQQLRLACCTKLYHNGVPTDLDPTTDTPLSPSFDFIEPTSVIDVSGRPRSQYVVLNFRSTFWAETIWRLARDKQAAAGLATRPLEIGELLEDRQAKVNDLREDVSRGLSGITAVQEFAAARADGKDKKIVLTIIWSFAQAREGEAGSTVQRDIILPHGSGISGDGEDKPMSPDPSMLKYDFSIPPLPPVAKMESFDSTLGMVGVDEFDFAQHMDGYGIPSATSTVGNIGLSTLQSPISFSADGGASAVGAGVWGNNNGLIPSTTIIDGVSHQDDYNHQQYSNDTDFTGGHIDLTFAGGVGAADDSQQTSASHEFESQEHYDTSQGLVADLDMDSLHTDPLLLVDSYHHPLSGGGDGGTGDADAGWASGLRGYTDSFFDNTGSGVVGGATAGSFHDGDSFSGAVAGGSFAAPTAAMVGLPGDAHLDYGHQDAVSPHHNPHQQQQHQHSFTDQGYSQHQHSQIQHNDFDISFRADDSQHQQYQQSLSQQQHHHTQHHQAFPGAANASRIPSMASDLDGLDCSGGGIKLEEDSQQHVGELHGHDDMQDAWI